MTARRLGGIPPIVTVLITISAVVAAAIVAYFLFTTTSSATKQPMLEVTGAYALCSSSGSCSAVYVTVRNVGAADVTITGAALEVAGVSSTFNSSSNLNIAVPLGGSANLRFTSSSNPNIPDGTGAVLTLTVKPSGGTNISTLSIGFKIAKP
jgi:cytoskeletal protein RodZ